jgi:micrococcal nuclease
MSAGNAAGADNRYDRLYHYGIADVLVIDGDTIQCSIDLGFDVWLHRQRVRLYGVNAPERSTESGLTSKQWLTDVLMGKPVVLESIGYRKCKYGRWLGRLFIGDFDVCEAMVSAGMATVGPGRKG